MLTEILEVGIFVSRGRTTRVIITVKICIFERSNEKSQKKSFLENQAKAAPRLLGHNGLQILK